ncbi:MAG: SAM-dependent methyltransferase [Opitutaceae bacterium]
MRTPLLLLSLAAALLPAAVPPTPAPGPAPATAAAPAAASAAPKRTPDVIYVPTPRRVVDEMLRMAELKPDDVVYDLGCGDGRIVIAAAQLLGVRAIGYDIDPERVKEARANVRAAGVEHLVRIEQADVFTLDLTGATVITLYLLPQLNVRLMPQLARLRPGSRILSHNFDMRGAKPVEVRHVTVEPGGDGDFFVDEDGNHTVYKWVVPWEPEGTAR